MESYPLQMLLSVRMFREKNAERAVSVAERNLREAMEDAERARKALEDWRRWKEEEEDRRYAAIMGTLLSIKQIDDFKADLAALAAQEVSKQEAIVTADKKVDDCRSTLLKAREDARVARRNTEKLEMHRNAWLEQARKEAEHLEDLELEDLSGARPARNADSQ